MDAPADALVLLFTRGVSLRTWSLTGGIDRELALYRRLAAHYQRVLLVSYGGEDDAALLRMHAPELELICNRVGVGESAFASSIPTLVSAALSGVGRIVVKTNQMYGGEVAVALARHLRDRGVVAGLVARGGYLWSRMAAFEHGPNSPQADAAAKTEGVLCPAADVVVGTTADMTEDLAWRYGLDPRRVKVIPNYVIPPVGEPPAAADREPGLILYAGQLIPRKRADILIDAVAMMSDEARAGVRLEVIGDGPLLPALRERAKGLPVEFRHRQSNRELMERMSRCSMYAQSSEMEGHPKTILEALAAGAPVIVADTPGQSETVTHGLTGLRIENSPEAFSRAFVDLLADPEWRDMLGAGAARAARAAFSLDAVVPLELEAHALAQDHAARSLTRSARSTR